MANKRKVILRGTPLVNEEGVASGAIRPGYLVKGVGTVAAQTISSGWAPREFALEREEAGTGFDNTYQGVGSESAYYASGDQVKVAACHAGMEVTAYIASGQNIQYDELLESAGDGTLKSGTTYPIAKSLEQPGAVTALTAIRVRLV